MAGLGAAGAAAGTAIAPGIGTAIGGVVGALADTFMGGAGSGGGSAGFAPQDAQSAIYGDLGMDGSGWNVNFSGQQSAGANKATPSVLESVLGTQATVGGVSGIPPVVLYGGLILLGVMLWKKSKSGR